MRVSRARLDSWSAEVDAAAADAELQVAAELESWAAFHPGHTVEEAREAAIDAVGRASSAYGRVSSASSGRLWNELAEAQGSGARFRVLDTSDPLYTVEGICGSAGKLRRGDAAGFRSDAARLAGQQVRRNARASMVDNCRREGVRWARVPTGKDTCAWCFMLASNGFVYKSAATADAGWHRGCDCRIVPDFDGGTTVEGYDPDGMAARWRACARTVGKDPDGTNEDVRRAIMREVSRRDGEWLRSGRPAAPSYESERALRELRGHERATRDVLASNGFPQHILERSNERGVKTADLLLSGVKADYKTPRGAGFNCIDQLMRDTGKKADIAVIHLQDGLSQMSAADAERHFLACGERRGVREALIIDYDGSVVRAKI